ncbi:hypothetical protein MD484_g5137, partial [Candolleomyces efflorescens]
MDQESKKKPICKCVADKGRNLVICIDGTSNQFGTDNTNVIELYNLIEKGKESKQRTYYNSGVGTFAKSSWLSLSSWTQSIDNKLDQAVAKNFDHIILGAYRWLSEMYEGPEDKIYLFGKRLHTSLALSLISSKGFSRGAYQVRCLAGMLSRVGLLHRGNEEQIPYAFELYKNNSPLAEKFKETFCQEIDSIHFLGVWDTVSSVGAVHNAGLPLTISNDHICFFRHALALDEARVKFLPEYVRGSVSAPEATIAEGVRPPRVKEVWFPGRHSDVGGGNQHNESLDLGRISLHWMAWEAVSCGLNLKPPTLNLDRYEDFFDKIPDSVTWTWWPLEYIPFKRWNYGTPKPEKKEKDMSQMRWPHRSGGRTPVPGQKIFFTILQKTREGKMRPYTPKADFSAQFAKHRFKNWTDIFEQAAAANDTRLLDEWAEFIEPDPLMVFNTTGVSETDWETLGESGQRTSVYGMRVCFSSKIGRWTLCDPWYVQLYFSEVASAYKMVYVEAILEVHRESLEALDPLELKPQAKLFYETWLGVEPESVPDHLQPPKAIENFPKSDYEWLRRLIQDKTLHEDIRVLCARILSCTFANDLGCALMYLVRSQDFLIHLAAMHMHKESWIKERALKLVLSLFDRVPCLSLIQEVRENRLMQDTPNSIKDWAVTLAKQFADAKSAAEKKQDYLVAEQILSKFLTQGKSSIEVTRDY